MLSSIILLQYKVKSFLGFQNLGRHFGTQKRLKKHCNSVLRLAAEFNTMERYSSNPLRSGINTNNKTSKHTGKEKHSY